MNQYNPEIERQLDELAGLCCDALNGDSSSLDERSTHLLKGLLVNGFERVGKSPLEVDLENRICQMCREHAMHRKAAVNGLAKQLRMQFDDLQRWESRPPMEENPPHAANVRSAATSTSRRTRPES